MSKDSNSFPCVFPFERELYQLQEKVLHENSSVIEDLPSGANIALTLTDVDEVLGDDVDHEIFSEMSSLEGIDDGDLCWAECARYFKLCFLCKISHCKLIPNKITYIIRKIKLSILSVNA